jgi:hypothetical protein
MSIILAICTVSAVSWIITREQLFARVRSWAKPRKWAYPITCMYCLAPWVTGLVCVVQRIEIVYFFPIVWGSYLNVAVFAKVRG